VSRKEWNWPASSISADTKTFSDRPVLPRAFGGLGYNVSPKVALIGGYRVLDVNYDKNNFVYDMNQRGPIFGLGFKL
jgi:hypothetical protein